MSDRMRPITMEKLLRWISEEYKSSKTIFGIPETHFFRKNSKKTITFFGKSCESPLGPAAGPHTQLAQNIVVSYLTGARFIELKTVQKMDSLEFEKPCIDAADEGYNTEWSTELSLKDAFLEYARAWIILHLLERLFDLSAGESPSFLFNMSVGYDLEGIKSPGMDNFINSMIDAGKNPAFSEMIASVKKRVEMDNIFKSVDLEEISPRIASSVTLSTMHGCPPDQIESICEYLLKEKKLPVMVKLNPTLVGWKTARRTLDDLGFSYITLNEKTFTKDLQYDQAVPVLKRLIKTAEKEGLFFGVKLSNTLPAVNDKGVLPGEEMYMSGRALFPLTIRVASMLSEDFEGNLPISFAGGIFQGNVAGVFEAGLYPVTVATELLKPGGYLRLYEMAEALEKLDRWPSEGKTSTELINELKESVYKDRYYSKSFRGFGRVSIFKKLPRFDCCEAPCTYACAIAQKAPQYIRLEGEENFEESLNTILKDNPLANITGHICDHKCIANCTRLDYEGAIEIRELKRIAAEKGWKEAEKDESRKKSNGVRVAIIGSGPAGLTAACFLARAGFRVTVFEKEKKPGGVVSHLLPSFRIPGDAISRDIKFIEKQGVSFEFGYTFGSDKGISPEKLKREGFKYIFLAVGAEVSERLSLSGSNPNVIPALSFLRSFKENPGEIKLGKKVVVVGGGNTAMDSARAALRFPGVESVTIVYRRTEKEMPADREEFENALRDGVIFKTLLAPESFSEEGFLTCRKMTLGEPDTDGRRKPVPLDTTETLEVDTVISAVGERVDRSLLKEAGLNPDNRGRVTVNPKTLETLEENLFIGGDALRGPSTVVEAMADGKRVAEAIALKEGVSLKRDEVTARGLPERIYKKRGKLFLSKEGSLYSREAERCLECDLVCNKCVDVCPNRANIALQVRGEVEGFKDFFQILHLDGLCNQCGNCATFCPYEGKPYEDKLTLYASEDDFKDSGNSGFFLKTGDGKSEGELRLNGDIFSLWVEKSGNIHLKNASCANHELNKALDMISLIFRNYGYLL